MSSTEYCSTQLREATADRVDPAEALTPASRRRVRIQPAMTAREAGRGEPLVETNKLFIEPAERRVSDISKSKRIQRTGSTLGCAPTVSCQPSHAPFFQMLGEVTERTFWKLQRDCQSESHYS
ncbi:hypothetical protein O0L34_g7372 [Tuta absoluta]|nr:hypothetical protein O0L34_g7372 [Tuta absoluta]